MSRNEKIIIVLLIIALTAGVTLTFHQFKRREAAMIQRAQQFQQARQEKEQQGPVLIADHDGIRLYRIYDQGRYVYYTKDGAAPTQ